MSSANLRMILVWSLAGLSTPYLRGQSSAAFEVASVKPAKPNDPRRPLIEFLPGGRFRAVNMPFVAILATAYNLPWQSVESLETGA